MMDGSYCTWSVGPKSPLGMCIAHCAMCALLSVQCVHCIALHCTICSGHTPLFSTLFHTLTTRTSFPSFFLPSPTLLLSSSTTPRNELSAKKPHYSLYLDGCAHILMEANKLIWTKLGRQKLVSALVDKFCCAH